MGPTPLPSQGPEQVMPRAGAFSRAVRGTPSPSPLFGLFGQMKYLGSGQRVENLPECSPRASRADLAPSHPFWPGLSWVFDRVFLTGRQVQPGPSHPFLHGLSWEFDRVFSRGRQLKPCPSHAPLWRAGRCSLSLLSRPGAPHLEKYDKVSSTGRQVQPGPSHPSL